MAAAEALGEALVARDCELVFGGGNLGLMGAVARTVDAGGKKVTGVIPRALADPEVSGSGVGEVVLVESMHERKTTMATLADAFIALPGGFGTLEELLEITTWNQIGIQAKPIGVLNIPLDDGSGKGYYDPLRDMIAAAITHGFVDDSFSELVIFKSDPNELLDALQAHAVPKGLDLDWGLDQS